MDLIHDLFGLSYREIEGVYPVSEDSLFFFELVKEQLGTTSGTLIDMGCGVGLISLLGASRDWMVYSIDREPRALACCRDNLKLNGLHGRQLISDLFKGIPRGIKGTADIITFNPPYVAGKRTIEGRREEFALMGGPEGFEIAQRSIEEGLPYLAPNGKMFLLGYRHWDIGKIVSSVDRRVHVEELATKDIDGEIFAVYWIGYHKFR